MSISNRFYERLAQRKNRLEIYYYFQRCLFNADLARNKRLHPRLDPKAEEENMLDQAHRLADLMEQVNREKKRRKR